mmetsp:Transcript_22394/g.33982  ORF Transcript_22394/g.33982 Transcript_22394/m.33982 type:complete len:1037 (+) Transcript_22394:105-3215(+)
MGLWGNYSNLWNSTFDEANEFTSQLKPASDVSIETVMASLYFNAIVFVLMLASYEILRRFVPSVYASRNLHNSPSVDLSEDRGVGMSGMSKLPLYNSYIPFDWVAPVFGVSWSTVRKSAGLDAYFFLRFIRMCVRITSVSTFWASIILGPVYATGMNGADGWYLVSMVNIQNDWRMTVAVIFMYLFSGFTFFVMKQEFSHWMELRMDFLGKGERNIDPQHHYSLMVENVPLQLRSDSALREYFERLFPGNVHSATVILNLPKLEALEAHCLRIVQRLEKAIAVYHATTKRPTQVIGKPRSSAFGIEMEFPTISIFSLCRKRNKEVVMVNEKGPYPAPGTLVDSISLHTREVADCNYQIYKLQQENFVLAGTGNVKPREANKWFDSFAEAAAQVANTIMDDSAIDNDLKTHHDENQEVLIHRAENMSGRYGSFSPANASPSLHYNPNRKTPASSFENRDVLEHSMSPLSDPSQSYSGSMESDKSAKLIEPMVYATKRNKHFLHPNSRSDYSNRFRRIIGRLGLDFLVAGLKYINRQFDNFLANVVGRKMSSTGFVTFLDLASASTAASTPLTHKPHVLEVHVAPEPRDIRWKSAHLPAKLLKRRENYANVILTLGIFLWSIPLAAIQAFATAEQVARLPGMDWVLTLGNGSVTAFINGYLPVVALLCLIMILPVIFEQIAINYENRKTVSDVQRSMLGRYFYYQLANIFLTVTAGSFWDSLADILDRPGNILEILGNSLPKVVGYFISFIITKILAGLPIVFLRVGALGRKLFLRSISSPAKATQRQIDGIYRRDNLLYGWEYPSQLLVVVICFTYACICPVILPFGAIYFVGSLMVYKKQVLYVYSAVYESGGTMFPDACNYMLFGLLCSQTILIGYTLIRQSFYEPLYLMPLPFITIYVVRYFRSYFSEAALQLSLERAVERDLLSDLKANMKQSNSSINSPSNRTRTMGFEERQEIFDAKLYRQPVLTAPCLEPMEYRRDQFDPVTEDARNTIKRLFLAKAANGQTRPDAIPEEFSGIQSEESIQIMASRSDIL